MGQQEIIRILEKNRNKWVGTTKITKMLKQKSSPVTASLNKMVKYREVVKDKIGKECYWKIRK